MIQRRLMSSFYGNMNELYYILHTYYILYTTVQYLYVSLFSWRPSFLVSFQPSSLLSHYLMIATLTFRHKLMVQTPNVICNLHM